MKKLTKWPYILNSERTPLVDQLLEILKERDDYIGELQHEINRLKKLPAKPKFIKDKNKGSPSEKSVGKRPGSIKSNKTAQLTIHQIHVIKIDNKPKDAVFKGYRQFTVQELSIEKVNHLFKCERWQKTDGSYIQAKLPKAYANHHFGPTLRAYVLHQHYHQGVTQSLLLSQLKEWGIAISSGQLNRVLSEDKNTFHKDKEAIFQTGDFVANYLQVDDTGARHKGCNGFCTYIGNEDFAYFQSTRYKNRINFLSCLQGEKAHYLLDEVALTYLFHKKLPVDKRQLLREWVKPDTPIALDQHDLHKKLQQIGITHPHEIKLCTEATLYAYLMRYRLFKHPLILSDEAGQFAIAGHLHGLCWLHVERKLKQLLAMTDVQAQQIKAKQDAFWQLYQTLQEYKQSPTHALKANIKDTFVEFCLPVGNYLALDAVLARIKKWEHKLLMVLDHPYLPIHNNTAERDIRDYVRRRKVSGGTRSNEGRRARDTFVSIKKTCQKVGISFWSYLLNQTHQANHLKPIEHYIYQKKAREQLAATSSY